MTDQIKPVYAGEAMLLRWSENSDGRTVTLRLDGDAGALHPFKHVPKGSRMQLCAVLVDDQENPQSPPVAPATPAPQVSTVESKATAGEVRKHFRDMPRSQQAALKCQDEEFQRWLMEDWRSQVGRCWPPEAKTKPERADLVLKEALSITSKRELDTNEKLGVMWDKLLTSFDYRGRT